MVAGIANEISRSVDARRHELITLAQDLIQIPSLSGDEETCAKLVSSRMTQLGYDQVVIDDVGNALGTIDASSAEGGLLFNGHIDHVPPGDMKEPYSPIVTDGSRVGVSGEIILGRAASDMKGALASMLMAGSVVRSLGKKLLRPLTVAGVVLEETQGLGSRHLAEREPRPSAVIIGESTNLDVAIGHRGSIGATITTHGVSCHASAPERGRNALYKMLPILERIREAAEILPSHPVLGKSTMTATTISLNPNIKNVVPNSCAVGLDVRNTPNFPAGAVIRALQDLVNEQRRRDPKLEAEVEIGRRMIKSYTGLERELDLVTPPFYIESDSSLARMTREAATTFVGREAQFKVWQFATDGPYFAQKGIPTVGFGPGEERFAHSAQDNVRVEDLIVATKVYAHLAVRYCREDAA